MKTHFRIFQLLQDNGNIHLKDIQKEDPELFRYHDELNGFDDEEKALSWVEGLTNLKGQFVVLKVFSKF
ncbi:MAG: hypothetical protein K0Q79_3771 [Flavipsychrobacter sp.]|nr:hypothetical protein [Flavipsychrobacter sp.]